MLILIVNAVNGRPPSVIPPRVSYRVMPDKRAISRAGLEDWMEKARNDAYEGDVYVHTDWGLLGLPLACRQLPDLILSLEKCRTGELPLLAFRAEWSAAIDVEKVAPMVGP